MIAVPRITEGAPSIEETAVELPTTACTSEDRIGDANSSRGRVGVARDKDSDSVRVIFRDFVSESSDFDNDSVG